MPGSYANIEHRFLDPTRLRERSAGNRENTIKEQEKRKSVTIQT